MEIVPAHPYKQASRNNWDHLIPLKPAETTPYKGSLSFKQLPLTQARNHKLTHAKKEVGSEKQRAGKKEEERGKERSPTVTALAKIVGKL